MDELWLSWYVGSASLSILAMRSNPIALVRILTTMEDSMGYVSFHKYPSRATEDGYLSSEMCEPSVLALSHNLRERKAC